jgi:membrane fusion protein (multidrug efflux system)
MARRSSITAPSRGLGVGTGGAFALLPAQNATGNWIKVVQRIPVRIALDPQELAEHPLRVGLSMEVTSTSRTSAADARERVAARTRYATDAFERDASRPTRWCATDRRQSRPAPPRNEQSGASRRASVTGAGAAPTRRVRRAALARASL